MKIKLGKKYKTSAGFDVKIKYKRKTKKGKSLDAPNYQIILEVK